MNKGDRRSPAKHRRNGLGRRHGRRRYQLCPGCIGSNPELYIGWTRSWSGLGGSMPGRTVLRVYGLHQVADNKQTM